MSDPVSIHFEVAVGPAPSDSVGSVVGLVTGKPTALLPDSRVIVPPCSFKACCSTSCLVHPDKVPAIVDVESRVVSYPDHFGRKEVSTVPIKSGGHNPPGVKKTV